jgi:uncharacterized protein YndB with AHSA1/START domain
MSRIESRIEIDAPIDRVWRAWTNPEELRRWFTDDARGSAERGATLVWVWRDVVEARAPERVVLETAVPGGDVQRLEVTLRRNGDGTSVELAQSGLPEGPGSEAMLQAMESGWLLGLAILKQYAEEHFGQDCRRFFVQRTIGDEAGLDSFFADENALARWLTRAGGLGEAGDDYRLELRDGASLTGRVLARSDREVALSWREAGGTIELKCFPGPEGAVAAVRGTSWTASSSELDAARQSFSAALDRLVGEVDAVRGAAAGRDSA